MRPTKHTDPVKRVEAMLDFRPTYKVVPPVNQLQWPPNDECAYMIPYFRAGLEGLIEEDRQRIAHHLNITNPTKDEYDYAAVYALVWHEFTYEAILDFVTRRDTRFGVVENLREKYDRCVEQIRAIQVQHLELIPRPEFVKMMVMNLRNASAALPIQEQNPAFLMFYYLKAMMEEGWISLRKAMASGITAPYVEKPNTNIIAVRVKVTCGLVREYCEVREYARMPEELAVFKAIRLAHKARAPWLVAADAQQWFMQDGKGKNCKVTCFRRDWMIDQGLWPGVKTGRKAKHPGVRTAERGAETPEALKDDLFGG